MDVSCPWKWLDEPHWLRRSIGYSAPTSLKYCPFFSRTKRTWQRDAMVSSLKIEHQLKREAATHIGMKWLSFLRQSSNLLRVLLFFCEERERCLEESMSLSSSCFSCPFHRSQSYYRKITLQNNCFGTINFGQASGSHFTKKMFWRNYFCKTQIITKIPSDTKLLLTKTYYEKNIFGKITNLTRNSLELSFFPGHFESAKWLKNYEK